MFADPTTLAILLLLVAFAAYVQGVAGFAYGLILMGIIGWLDLAPLPAAAILVSLTSLVNVLVALRGYRSSIQWQLLMPVVAGMLPALVGGVLLLDYLSNEAEALLKSLLGITLLGGGSLLMLKPTPYQAPSGPLSLIAIGILGGISGGLFSVSGPPIVFHFYRQPLPLGLLKITLLALFGFSTLTRIAVVSIEGQMTLELLWFGLLAAPIVSLSTLAARRFPPPLSEDNLKRCAFFLVAGMGLALLI